MNFTIHVYCLFLLQKRDLCLGTPMVIQQEDWQFAHMMPTHLVNLRNRKQVRV